MTNWQRRFLGETMRWLILISFLLGAGCSPGYVLPQAATLFEFSSAADMDSDSRSIEKKLVELGFEAAPDEPVPDFMLRNLDAAMRWRQLEGRRFSRMQGGLLDRESLFVTLTHYPDSSAAYQPVAGDQKVLPRWPFLEVRLSEARPDGFSSAAFAIYSELKAAASRPNTRVVDLAIPSASDDQAYSNYLLNGFLGGAAWWLATWIVGMLLIGGPASWLFARLGWTRSVRRIAIVIVGGLLVTPMPTPAILTTILVPNILLLPSPGLYADLFAYGGAAITTMFAISICLSALVALAFIRKQKSALAP